MGEHSSPTDRPEPVALIDAAKLVVSALVAAGWIVLDDATIATVGSAAGLLLFLILTVVTRAQVTPISDPVDEEGRMLQTVGELLAEHDAEAGPDAAEAG